MSRKKTLVSIIGIGLLGGSLALALRKRGGFRLVGWSPSASTRRKARRCLEVVPTIEEAVNGAGIVVIGSPSAAVVPVLRRILPALGKDTLVMDMASVKASIVREAARLKDILRHFVPCHPMAGKEKSGVSHADPDLYRDRKVFLTPIPRTPKTLLRRARSFWRQVGAHPIVMDARTHDARVAMTSHTPHLLACALTELYGKALRRDPGIRLAVGTGFRDVTRIAASSPAMWTDIVELNAPEIRRNLSTLKAWIARREKDLRTGRRSGWNRFFSKVKAVRERL